MLSLDSRLATLGSLPAGPCVCGELRCTGCSGALHSRPALTFFCKLCFSVESDCKKQKQTLGCP